MRMTQIFNQTLRDVPSEADVTSHQLLLRAGFIRQLAAGVFSELPLARRSLAKIEAILRQEMNAIGGQEIKMPVVHPGDLWKETGRWYQIDAEMGRFKDRSGRDMALGMTHEEVVADLARREIRSYRQLPRLVYQIQTKWRDDPRPRAGLIRAREFTMKDSYSLDAGWAGLEAQYRAHYQAYFNIFHRCGLPVIAVRSDTGMMGGKLAHEFMFLNPIGEDTLMLCAACGESANRQVARFRKPPAAGELPQPLEKVATPDCKSIEALAAFLNVPKARTAKAVFLMARLADRPGAGSAAGGEAEKAEEPEQFVFAVIRGDMDVNETKLANALGARSLRPATEEEIRSVGAAPGYASPVGLSKSAAGLPFTVVVDDAVPASPNLVAGANEPGYHLLNVNFGRDYPADLVVDIAAAQDGDACERCGAPLRAERGVEVGNIFQLGDRYSKALGCSYLDENGQEQPVIMGSYGIGLGRLLACVAEARHDEHGLCWPISVAPFTVHLVALKGKGITSTVERADQIYRQLWEQGIETLYDDRDESPGVKFNDADLIGLPLRLTVSERALQQGGVEFKPRDRAEREIIPFDNLIGRLQAEISSRQAAITAFVVPVPYA